MRILASQVTPRVRFRVSADTTVRPDTVFLRSRTPSGDAFLASVFTVLPLVAKGALPPPPKDRFVIGGLAGGPERPKVDLPPPGAHSGHVLLAPPCCSQS